MQWIIWSVAFIFARKKYIFWETIGTLVVIKCFGFCNNWLGFGQYFPASLKKTISIIAKLSLTLSIDWVALYSLVRSFVRPSAWRHLHLSPPYDVLDHTNHIFSESLSSCYDNDRDKDKDTQTQTKTNTKCFQDPM